jgi:hypothetical protein
MQTKPTEADLCKQVVEALTQAGWEIYQEVEGARGRCDIVAVRGKIHWAIEAKLSFGFPVLEQAYNWRSVAHYTSIAVPSVRGGLSDKICRDYGIGILQVAYNEVRERLTPKLFRQARGFKLHEDQKIICEAGGNRGGHWTPFKQTVKMLVAAAKTRPGIEFRELIRLIDHHYSSYSSAKSNLRGFIGSDVIPELRCEIVDRKLCVFHADHPPLHSP